MTAPCFDRAVASWHEGRHADAERWCRLALDAAPAHLDAHRLLAEVLATSGRGGEALAVCRRLVELVPADAIAQCNLAILAARTGRDAEALLHFERALALDPRVPAAVSGRIRALLALNQSDQALAAATEAVRLAPDHAEAWIALGLASVARGGAGPGLAAFERAVALDPRAAQAQAGRGLALAALGRGAEALASYGRAVELNPGDAAVFVEVGHLMVRLGRLENARAAFDAALQLEPDHVFALEGRTRVLAALNRNAEALPGFLRLLQVAPHLEYLQGGKFHAQLQCCDWSEYEAERRMLAERVRRGERADNPFSFLVHNDSPADQRLCATIYVRDRFPAATRAERSSAPRPAPRLRVGYLSADFGEHPVAQLLAAVLESHDRARFETFAFASGADDGGALRKRVKRSVEHFIDVTELPDAAVAAGMAERSIDVLIDLGGHTTGSRTRVLAYRPAPLQVAFLGYPGTLGADFVDYVIADRHVIPEVMQSHYAEQPIYLPQTCLPGERHSALDGVPDRRAAGLPRDGLVFCCFNAAYKIAPPMFEIWMRILRRVPGILWLRDMADVAKQNLAREAARCGVDPGRLIHARRVPTPAEHRARLALADLFLDTHPYNAHSTAHDALGAGVPVLTLRGDSFAARVATSLLHAVGLPQLSVGTPAAYEELAVSLAAAPPMLAALKSHLARVRDTAPAFDPERFCRHLEYAYVEITARQARGEPPSPLSVPD